MGQFLLGDLPAELGVHQSGHGRIDLELLSKNLPHLAQQPGGHGQEGRDEQGEIRHLHTRGTLTGSHFRQTLPGSEKAYSFHWLGTSGKLYAFEAPIDMLSYISLHPEGWLNHTYVALCGVSAAPIYHLLETQPQLEEVTLCLDNDEAGRNAARRIAGELLQEWNVTMSAEFPTLKDWNVELLTNRQEEAQGLTMSM